MSSRYDSLEPLTDLPENCEVCSIEIKTMAYRGTGVCGDLHNKVRSGKLTREQADAIASGKLAN
jgi:hypothetical protein